MSGKLLSFIVSLFFLCGSGASAQNTAAITSVKGGDVIIPLKLATASENNVRVMLNGVETEYTVQEGGAILLSSPSATGIYDITVSADGSDAPVYTGKLVNLSRTVDRKVVFEEFTGFGCGWCPRGLVALEEARELYGRNIVLISAHFDDPISCREYNLMKEPQLPSSHLDRRYMSIDPYYGTSGGGIAFGINEDIKKCMEIAPEAEVNVEAYIEGDMLYAKSDVKFLFSGEGNYAVAFVVTEDGMHNEKWTQLNNYTQIKGLGFLEESDPKFDRWINGTNPLKGYVYDDVAIVAKGIKYGIDNSLPASFVEEESNTFEVEFDLKKLKKIQNRKNLNVCAFVYDRTKKNIVNANYMSFEHETAIEGVEADDENVVETARCTVDGRMINTPEKGINIVKYSDGSVRKVVVR